MMAATENYDDYSQIQSSPVEHMATYDMAAHENSGRGQLFVFAFQKNSFITSGEAAVVRDYNHEYLLMEQEQLDRFGCISIGERHRINVVVGRTDAKEVYDCDDGADYDEDACLYGCLADKFVAEFGCLHVRIALAINNEEGQHRVCGLDDLANATADYVAEMEASMGNYSGVVEQRVEEVGLIKIRDWLAGFNEERASANRCGCKLPCRRTLITIQTFQAAPVQDRASVFAVFQVRENEIMRYLNTSVSAAEPLRQDLQLPLPVHRQQLGGRLRRLPGPLPRPLRLQRRRDRGEVPAEEGEGQSGCKGGGEGGSNSARPTRRRGNWSE